MDSVSVKTTFKEKLQEKGIIFSSFSEAVRENLELVRKYLGTVVPYRDNYFAALNSAVFSDGSFVYIPKGVRCPMELSTYSASTRATQASLSARSSCAMKVATCPIWKAAPHRCATRTSCMQPLWNRGERKRRGEVQYGTKLVSGDAEGRGGVLNLVTKRGTCAGRTASFRGRRWRPVLPLPGNIPVAS